MSENNIPQLTLEPQAAAAQAVPELTLDPSAPAAPAEPAPEKDEPSADSLFSTDFKLNLDELKFGRNYSGEN